jgi:DNA-directed RNA polymerase specialized sigma24 family protein
MNASEREMISMAFFQGASHADMAVRLGLPEAVVRGQLDSAIEVLRRALASH